MMFKFSTLFTLSVSLVSIAAYAGSSIDEITTDPKLRKEMAIPEKVVRVAAVLDT